MNCIWQTTSINKVKDALSIFHTFHTLDREKIAQEFAKNINLLGNKKYLFMNTGRERQKGNISENLNDLKISLQWSKIKYRCFNPQY